MLYLYVYDPSSRKKAEISTHIRLEYPSTINKTIDSVHPSEPEYLRIKSVWNRVSMCVSKGLPFDEVVACINSPATDVVSLTTAIELVQKMREQELNEGIISLITFKVVNRIINRVKLFEQINGAFPVSSILFSSNEEGNAMAVIRAHKLFEDFYRMVRSSSRAGHNSAQYETKLLDGYLRMYFDRIGGTFKRYKPGMKSTDRPVVALPKDVCVDLYNRIDLSWTDYYLEHGINAEPYIYAHKMMVFGIFTCLRHSDLLTLCVDDFQDSGGNMWLVKHAKKTKSIQKTIIPSKLADLVRDAKANGNHYILSINGKQAVDPSRYIWKHKTVIDFIREMLSQYPECHAKYKFTTRQSDNTFSVANKRLVDVFRVHDLRATGITMHLSNGMSERNVCNISGHRHGSAAFNRYVAYVKEFHEAELVDSFSKLGII
jgi:integrase